MIRSTSIAALTTICTVLLVSLAFPDLAHAAGSVSLSGNTTTSLAKIYAPNGASVQVTTTGTTITTGQFVGGNPGTVAPQYTLTCNGNGTPCNSNAAISVTITNNATIGADPNNYIGNLEYVTSVSGCTVTNGTNNSSTTDTFSAKCGSGGTVTFSVELLNITIAADANYSVVSVNPAISVSVSP